MRIPFSIITGFLGSGKTTLLNQLLNHSTSEKIAVVVNEFGEIDIDGDLIESADENIISMVNGCLCCSIRNDLVETIDLLMLKKQQDNIDFQRLVIETTGLADPSPILQTLSDPQMVRYLVLDGVITVVDAEFAMTTLQQFSEAVKQVAMADRIIVSKCDLVSVSIKEQSLELISSLSDCSPICIQLDSKIEKDALFNVGLNQTHREKINTWLPENSLKSTQHSEIKSFTMTFECPISRAVLGLWLMELCRDFGDNLLRIKGIMQLQYEENPIVIHGVQHRMYHPVTLSGWPSDNHQSRLVFITKNFKQHIAYDRLAVIKTLFN